MKILESIAYIALGFVPTLALLELSYRIGKKSVLRKTIPVGSKATAAEAKSFSKLQA